VQTRNGLKARIICTDCSAIDYPIVALVQYHPGEESPLQYRSNGQFRCVTEEYQWDLVNIRVKKWVWIYRSGYTNDLTQTNLQSECSIKRILGPRDHIIGRILESEIEE